MNQENTTSKRPLIRYVNLQQMSWRAVDFHRCEAWTDRGSGADAGAQRQRTITASSGSRRAAAQEKATTDGGR